MRSRQATAVAGRDPAGQQRDRRDPADGRDRRGRALGGSLLLADCAQSAGKMPLPDADFIAVSAHKLGGPPGIGALLVRDLATLEPSGGQEQGYRRGTQDAPAAAGFAAALESRAFDMSRLAELRRRLDEGVMAAGGVVIAEDCAPHRQYRRGRAARRRRNRACWSSSTSPASRSARAAPARSGKMQDRALCSQRWAWRRTIASRLPPHQLRAGDARGRYRRFPRRMAPDRRSGQRRAA